VRLSEEDLYVIRKFLADRHLLSPERRDAVAAKLAAGMKKRLNLMLDVMDPILLLESIYREHTHEDPK